MINSLHPSDNLNFHVNPELRISPSIVALESAVITHGLPRPKNLLLAREMEHIIRENGAIPATIGILDGVIHIGLTDYNLKRLASENNVIKISRRDFATALLKRESGGTTVAGTMFAAQQAGIRVLATGGIGGVHEVASFDISTDLSALADTPMIVVCAGAKAILDLPATLEYLETLAVPVIGYRTSEFPAFYSCQSGLPVSVELGSPQEIVQFAHLHWGLGMKSSMLVCQPISSSDEIPREQIDVHIRQARREGIEQGIHGQRLTPFLLSRLDELTQGRTVEANLKLLFNNAKLAAQIAVELTGNPSI